jgi:hypothetical protein
MAKLPYTFTICPDQEAPKNFTASCAEMGVLLMNSPDGDLTINQRRLGAWDAWTGGGLDAPLEEKLHDLVQKGKTK